ncbi:MAG: hemin transporter [Microbacteriaceae bacterium]|nr:hemin transporter [Microbacteriaceae bacterium]
MLSATSFPVIEQTLPVVGENLAEIARRFYSHMFDERPDLMDGLVNRGNQADGRQQQALAGSVAAFASFLVNTPGELPDHLLARISHKHLSLGLGAEQYQIVHDHLMWAIVDVLGDAVTTAVAAAWDEVYWLMANTLINAERVMYDAAGLSPDTVRRTSATSSRPSPASTSARQHHRPPRRRRLLPLRASALHAVGAQRSHRARRVGTRHPVRGLRPRPLARRLRVAATWPGRSCRLRPS